MLPGCKTLQAAPSWRGFDQGVRNINLDQVGASNMSENALSPKLFQPPPHHKSIVPSVMLAARSITAVRQVVTSMAVFSRALSSHRVISKVPVKPAYGRPLVATRSYATRDDMEAFDEVISEAAAPVEPQPTAPTASPATTTTVFPELTVPIAESLGETAFNDWSKSYHGLSTQPFPAQCAEILQAPLDPHDIEMKPGTVHL